jgi:nucleotidyltransferase substrate binding protein (TIGR01987 family)
MVNSNQDIRWQQRYSNFNKALSQLEVFVLVNELNDLEKQGLIKAFEYTYELGWKTLQDLLKYNGYVDIVGPRPVIEQSFQDGYITDGMGWMQMHKSRNLTSHTYDKATANEIIQGIQSSYFELLKDLKTRLDKEL